MGTACDAATSSEIAARFQEAATLSSNQELRNPHWST